MSVGNWNRGNGVAAATSGNPRIYWTRSWSGGDSVVTVTVPHGTANRVYYKTAVRKVSTRVWQKTKSGKYAWVVRETYVKTRVAYSTPIVGYRKFRITTPDQAVGVYPTSIAHLIPNALKKREADAGLSLGTPHVEEITRRPLAINPLRAPKRARKADNAYTLNEMYMRDLYCYRNTAATTQAVPQICSAVVKQHGTVMGFITEDWTPAALLDANDQIRLVNKLRDKVVGSSFNAAVTLGELNQSIDLVVNSATRIARYLGHLTRGNFAAAARAVNADLSSIKKGSQLKKTPKATSSMHLELEYGWKPLLNDVVDGAEALAHALNTPVQKTYRVAVGKDISIVGKSWVTPSCGIPGYFVHKRGVKTQRRGLIVRFKEKPSLPKLLGLLDPEVVMWERLPFSFVADWFIPLGDWLTARGFSQGLNATFITSDKRTGMMFQPYGSGLFVDAGQPEARFTQVLFDRTISTSLKVPKPVVIPLSKALSWGHMTNAVALLISNHGGRGYK